MEWLESDGLGGFAMGTVVGVPMRRYHALLNCADGSPAHRVTLVNAVEAWLLTEGKRYPLSTFCFNSEDWHPHGVYYLKDFSCAPWPCWHFSAGGIEVEYEIFMPKDSPTVCLSWHILNNKEAKIEVRPFLTSRFYHSLHKENSDFSFTHQTLPEGLLWKPYNANSAIYCYSNARYSPDPLWFKNIAYDEDRRRGSDYKEDWASPGLLNFPCKENKAFLIFSADAMPAAAALEDHFKSLRLAEKNRRTKLNTVLEKAADHYVVKRGQGKTIIAGYPWFADWGRDTFISMRGLCLANGQPKVAENILIEWSKTIKNGLLPNRFSDQGEEAEYNSVDASLWFIIVCYELLTTDKKNKSAERLLQAIDLIVENFINGTLYEIKADKEDGLLRAGTAGMQLTWMDAKIGDYVVTPRIGKAVEIQALWINALNISNLLLNKHKDLYKKALKSFNAKFWNPSSNCLFDVVDVEHVRGKNDPALRPNQVFAVGGLPFSILENKKAFNVVETVEKHLLTPVGLRSLSPDDPNYRGRYGGDAYQRDTAYHQGTVWPWLLGAFVEAWLKTKGPTKKNKQEAKKRFLDPLLLNINRAGLGHLSEIYDADMPHISRGCPFQAWSVAEALRLEKQVLS